jgi:hypothetical protein
MTTRFFSDFNTTYKDGTPGKDAAAQAAIDRLMERHAGASLVPTLPTDPLIGLRLRLDRSCDRRLACCRTPGGAHLGVIEAGTGPHGHGLRCSLCRRHRGWLPVRAADLLRRLFRDGRLSALPTLHDRSISP